MTPIPLAVFAAAITKAKKAKKQRQFLDAILNAATKAADTPTAASKSNPGRCMCSTQGWDVWDWEFWYHECYRPLEQGECQ